MYHIRNDKRAARSANLIYDGLAECLKKKSFEQVTITDIQKTTGVARTTIYRCFDNLSDVLYWKCDLCFQEALSCSEAADNVDEFELISHYFSYWVTHSEILELLIKNNRQDIIYACHLKNAKTLEEMYGKLPDMDERLSHYYIAVRTSVTIGVLKAWLNGGKKETADQLLDIIVSVIGKR